MFETDALKTALRFIAQLDGRMMTSTASRLAVVQREIDNLAAALNPDPQSRTEHLQRRIADLQQQLDDVQAGRIAELTPEQAVEGIREVYALSVSLRADFRRVEDSWREADRALREAIISARHHRGAVMDQLLDGHANLLNTQEGRVFDSFHQQLSNQTELTEMRQRIRQILAHPAQTRRSMACSTARCACWCSSSSAKPRPCRRAGAQRARGQPVHEDRPGGREPARGPVAQRRAGAGLRIDWQRQAVRRQSAPLPRWRGPGQRRWWSACVPNH